MTMSVSSVNILCVYTDFPEDCIMSRASLQIPNILCALSNGFDVFFPYQRQQLSLYSNKEKSGII